MNQDHVLGGITAYFGIDQIAIVLQAWQHVDAKVAAAEAAILFGLGVGLVQVVRSLVALHAARAGARAGAVTRPGAVTAASIAALAMMILPLAACAPATGGGTPATATANPADWGAGLQLVQQQLVALEPTIEAIPGLDVDKWAAAKTDIAAAGTLIAALNQASTAADGKNALTAAEAALNAVVDAGVGLPLPAEAKLALTAAAIALPSLELALNGGISLLSAQAAAMRTATAP